MRVLRRADVAQALLIGLLVFLPVLANTTLSPEARTSGWNLLAYLGLSLLLATAVLALPLRRLIFLPLVILGLAYSSYVWCTGYDVGYHAISAVYDTNANEAEEFLHTPMAIRSLILLAILLIGLAVVLGRRWKGPWAVRRVRSPRAGLLVTVAAASLLLTSWKVVGHDFADVYPLKFLYQNLDYWREVHTICQEYAELDYTYEGPPARRRPLTCLVVIGESARAANWSLYGYERETNPELRQWMRDHPDRTVVYPRAVPAGRVTRVSVPAMLSVATTRHYPTFYEHPSVLRVFREAGLQTYMASAQPATGYYEGLPNLMLNDAEVRRRTSHNDDAKLLPVLDEFLDDEAPVKLIVFQLQGSHLRYGDRYPESFEVFSGRDRLDAYDNSLLYTDHILVEMLRRLEARPEPALMIYVSDHGENLDDNGDGNFSHGAREITCHELEIPMVACANGAFARAHPRRTARLRRSARHVAHHDMIAHTLLGLAGLKIEGIYRPEYDMTARNFGPSMLYFADTLRDVQPFQEVQAVSHLFPENPAVAARSRPGPAGAPGLGGSAGDGAAVQYRP